MAAISQVTKRYPGGLVDYQLRIYPGKQGVEKILHIDCRSDEFIPRRWRLKHSVDNNLWECTLKRIRPGTGLSLTIEINDGRTLPFVPIGESDVVNGVVRVPDCEPAWLDSTNAACGPNGKHDQQTMAILLEQTLEGLLADYDDGTYFTDAAEEFLNWSIAARLLQTRIPEQIRDLGYTEIMFPLYASVADRCHLDPKFNYLVYNLSADWQLGTTRELRALVHRFRDCGIELVPDLVFVHQVSNPYDGSSDDLNERVSTFLPYQDADAFLFRDYGTWHFDLEDPIIREIICDKILETILTLDLQTLRVDYIDGLVMQYANRSINYSKKLLEELKHSIKENCPNLQIIGEAFQTAGEPEVQSLIDSTYAPRGFAVLDLLLSPGHDHSQVIRECVEGLTEAVQEFNSQTKAESNYSQLHDECWQDDWISLGRPHTPWAYGSMPMGLSLKRVDQLIEHGWIDPKDRIHAAACLTQMIRVLGTTLSFTRWMETSGCLSLDQGRLDDDDHWKFSWNDNGKLSNQLFPAEGLNKEQRLTLLSRLKANVTATNQLLIKVGLSESNPLGKPLRMVHGDVHSGLSAYVRWGRKHPNPVLVLLNLSPQGSGNGNEYTINLESAGWSTNHHPQTLKSVIQPLTSRLEQPLLLTQSRGSPGRYQLSHALAGYEVALFEVPIHGR
jgi:1,4-alpha-glucan branching enzyme